jgi:ribonuclease Z
MLPLPHSGPHLLEDCPKWRIPGVPWTLQGHSHGGERTGFWIPELRLGLDAGVSSRRRMAEVLVTHGHGDHVSALPFLTHSAATRVLAPAVLADALPAFCHAFARLDHGAESMVDFRGVVAGDTLPIQHGTSTATMVTVVPCQHSVPCVGYVLSTARRGPLLPEYAALPRADLVALARGGTKVHGPPVRTPRLVFLGDTNVRALTPELLTCGAPIVVECTLLSHTESWVDHGHVSWVDLEPIVRAHPDTTFVLIHFSQRYSDEEVREFFKPMRPPNVSLWLDSGLESG